MGWSGTTSWIVFGGVLNGAGASVEVCEYAFVNDCRVDVGSGFNFDVVEGCVGGFGVVVLWEVALGFEFDLAD